jgi:GT2 family glycosyltransferase
LLENSEISHSPLVYAVVLAWNQVTVTLECLESLSKSHYPALRIVVVDNGSTDLTHEIVSKNYPDIEVIRLVHNVGLARGYNHGIEYALNKAADYVIAMNNDTVVAPEMVAELVKAIQNHPRAGMVSPKIYHFFGDRTRLWCAGAKWQNFPPRIKLIGSNAPDGAEFQHEFTLPYVTSCCILMSREALEKVGFFDTGYYFYYDDWDLSERYRAAGFEIWFVPAAHIWHKVSVSTQKTNKPKKWWFVMGRSSVRFYLKYKPEMIFVLYTLWFTLRETAKLKPFQRVLPYLCGVGEGLAEQRGWRP